jgi:hypothetical protein
MSYNFLVFTDSVPLAVHNFPNPTTQSYYVYTPPKRDKPYLFKAGKRVEAIYAFLFPMDDKDRSDTENYSRFSDRKPDRLKTTLAILDLAFGKSVNDYAAIIRQISQALSDDILMITECGVRGRMSLSMTDPSSKSDCVLAPKGQRAASMFFMNIVEHNLEKLKQPLQEAFDNACATNVLGDYLYAKTPRWWEEAFTHYGTEATRRLPKAEDGSAVLRSDGEGVQESSGN